MLRLSTRLAVGVCLMQFFSCQKNIKPSGDSLEFQTSSDAAVVSEFADCKLRTIEHQHPGISGQSVKGTFVYHPDGLPQQLTYNVGGTGNPNYYFIYDSKRRLRELRVGYSLSEQAEPKWHKYGYNNLDQIVVDTIYNQQVPGDTTISQITYDAQNRVISETKRKIRSASTWTTTYTYDSRGNLSVESSPSNYDYQKSIFRSHPLFQFIHRNYSQNNSVPQSKYNVKGLPLANSPLNHFFFNAQPGTSANSGVTRATYDCDGFVPANEFLNCKLRTVTHERISPPGVPNVEIKGTFVYHPDGLPAQLTYTNSTLPNYYFVYDNKRRLRELQETYERNTAGPVVFHRYGYNNLNQIVVDTLVNFTSFSVSSARVRVIATFTYDGQGRVVNEYRTGYSGGVPGETENIVYTYDSRGNLVVPGWPPSSYDNKVSIFRAHSLFQFIHRNYSKNNAAVQSKYNSKGLPLSNKPMNHRFFNAYPNNPGETEITKINYDCP